MNVELHIEVYLVAGKHMLCPSVVICIVWG